MSILLVSKGFHLVSLSVALSENVQRVHKYITARDLKIWSKGGFNLIHS